MFILLFFFAYSYPAFEFEGRFFVLCLPLVIVLTVDGVRQMCRMLAPYLVDGMSGATRFVAGLLFVFCGYGLIHYWPQHIWPQYSGDYEAASPAIHLAALESGIEQSIVLINPGTGHLFRYSSGFLYNDPQLTSSVLYARDLGDDANNCLHRTFPNRRLYRFLPTPDWSHGKFLEVVAPHQLDP